MEYPKSSKDSGIRVNNLHSAVQVAKTGPVFGKDVFTLVSLIIHTSNPDTVAALQEVGVGGRVPQSEMSPFLPIPVSSFPRMSLSPRLRVCFTGSPHLPFDGCQVYIPVLISRCSGPSVQEGASPKNR